MNMSRLATIAALGIVMTGTAAAAQTLGDVARMEKERRGQVHGGKIYTNADLAPEPTRTPVAATAANTPLPAQAVPAAPSSAPPESSSDEDAIPSPRDMPADEYWRTQTLGLHARVAEARSQVEALETRLDDLNRQANPANAAALARERALTERSLEGARRDLKSLTDALRNLESVSKTTSAR